METIHDFDEFLKQLRYQIKKDPTQRKHILLQAAQEAKCPYLKRKIKQINRLYID